ncbi:MAG TPA: carboxypeptidase-like regulatory domain-containing protein, partial [Chitinophagaceae bacterium]|nr:carboxypeptidase-like regulatory domain-containing protein [Chitinophagaceae bacterium]
MRYTILSFILLFCVHPVLAQSPIQTIRGMVTDEVSGKVLSHASISLVHTSFGTFSDSVGSFILQNIPIGRYDIKISYVGYESMMLKEIQVSSAKELFLAVTLREHTGKLSGVVIQSKVNKEQALNSMAPVSARMLSVEEARRYAGGFDDPARLVSAFAGVNSTIGSNAISVRGNNPQSLQWKLEGVEISNPNHFADLAVFGGGGITALSSQLMTNSDFFTGAMPAEYQNALSGVFDLYMRNGNARKREHTFQLGLIGIDAASEGPFI